MKDSVKLAAEQRYPYIGAYIFEAVTNELTYTYFRTMKQIPREINSPYSEEVYGVL